jgi:hypothetical protein
LLDAAAAANAEALARREGRELVGKARGVGALTAVPTSLLERKPASCASALSGLGCLGVTECLSPATAASMLAFVAEENAARQADVVAGRAAFGDFFGGVNVRAHAVAIAGCLRVLMCARCALCVRSAGACVARSASARTCFCR